MLRVCIVLFFASAICDVRSLSRLKTEVDAVQNYPFPFISKEQWGGSPAKGITALRTPVPRVVIHHSYIPGACHNLTACSQAMRSMQRYHQETQGWLDIGYNFAVGSDGAVYEGRAWNAVGAHAAGFNSDSIGIVLIGDWVDTLPPLKQLEITKQLIAYGVKTGFIQADYELVGHRQLGDTECPGELLYREIKTWEQFAVGRKLKKIINS